MKKDIQFINVEAKIFLETIEIGIEVQKTKYILNIIAFGNWNIKVCHTMEELEKILDEYNISKNEIKKIVKKLKNEININENKVNKAVEQLFNKYSKKLFNFAIHWDIKNDLISFKKYEKLNTYEMLQVFLIVSNKLGKPVKKKEIEEHLRAFIEYI